MNIELQLKIQDLNARYAQAIDDCNKLEAWPDFFTEDGRYRVTTAENFERGLPLGIIYATSRACCATACARCAMRTCTKRSATATSSLRRW